MGDETLSYLNSRVNKEVQDEFLFGYYPRVNEINLLTSLIGEDTLRELDLLYSKDISDSSSARTLKFSYFEDHPLILPYRDVYGNVIGIVGRSLLDDEERKKNKVEKYKNTKFKKKLHLFGLYEAKKTIIEKDLVYVVEGQFDVIKAMEKGIRNIVALGSSNISDYQVGLITRYTKNILLLLDNDTAGDKGREIAISKFGHVANINNIYLPEGYKDIDDYLKHHDADSLSFGTKNSKIYY